MARATELPQLITEFVDMSKEYLRQETIEPAKQLGRFAGFSLAAAVLFSIGSLFLSVAGVRLIVSALKKKGRMYPKVHPSEFPLICTLRQLEGVKEGKLRHL